MQLLSEWVLITERILRLTELANEMSAKLVEPRHQRSILLRFLEGVGCLKTRNQRMPGFEDAGALGKCKVFVILRHCITEHEEMVLQVALIRRLSDANMTQMILQTLMNLVKALRDVVVAFVFQKP